MELFKTAAGSWIYPEPSVLRLGGAPLFTGSMDAAVGSYGARAWRVFDVRFVRHPPMAAVLALAAAVYVNFFTHHWLPDVRLALFAASVVLLLDASAYRVWRRERTMPLVPGFVLVALFIWVAENVGTYAQAWRYPNQAAGRAPVGFGKLGRGTC